MPEFEPKQFGKYYLLEKLAVGGMAEIYKAKTFGVDGFEKMLALKRILPHCSADKDFIAMLVDEAKLSVTLSHANIVQVYDLGKVGDDYFISMEFINGPNLRDIIYRCREKGTKIPHELAAYMISEVCKGLDYAHRKTDTSGQPLNIVHRDISPQNILLSYEGEVKIVDFGIAKAAMNISHTMAGILKGKIAYMSPEQALGKTVDYRADIFSTGILLYEALTGEKLFTGESQFEVLKKIRTTRFDLTKLPEAIPDGLKQVLIKALAYYPKDRYLSAGDMQIDLTRYLYTTHVDFTPQKLATFMRDLFNDEISKQHARGAVEKNLEAQTSSINIAEEALQENLVHREETSPTVQAPHEGTETSASSEKELTDRALFKKGFGARIAAVASIAVLLAGLGFAYFKFIHPKVAKQSATTTTGQTGTVNVFSTPAGAKIFLDGKSTDLTTPAILESLTLGREYKIKLSKDQFADTEKTVKVNTTDPLSVDMQMEVASGSLEISTDPPGASIIVNDEATGQSTPAAIKGLQLDSDIKIALIKEGYKNFEQSVKLTNNKPQTLIAKLIQADAFGSIKFTSSPPGAEIFFNGRDTGLSTPASIPNVPVGEKQNVRLVKTGYDTVTKTVAIKDTSELVVETDLIAVAGTEAKPEEKKPETAKKEEKKTEAATANVSSKPAGAKIFLNGKNTGLKTPARIGNLEVGRSYAIKLERPNYEPFTKEITISSAGALSIKGELKEIQKEAVKEEKKTAPVEQKAEEPASVGGEAATLKVNSDPSGAEVFVNAEYKGATPLTITGIRPGSVSLLVNKEGKSRYSQKISLKPGEKKDIGTVRLGELYGQVSISSTPSRASVIFDGEDIGAKTPVTIRKVRRDKQHTVKLVLSGYKAWERSFDMNDTEDKKFNVMLEE